MSTRNDFNTTKKLREGIRELFENIYPQSLNDEPFKIEQVLNRDHIEELALKLSVSTYDRQFDVYAYVLASIWYHSIGKEEDHNRLCDLYRTYNKLTNGKRPISMKAWHNKIRKPQMELLVKTVLEELMSLANNLAIKQSSAIELAALLHERLGICDLIAIDGTSLLVRPASKELMTCKTVGRKKLEREGRSSHKNANSDQACGIKVHAAFSLFYLTFKHLILTEGVGDEREQASKMLSQITNSLLVLDRGYDSVSLFGEILRSNNHFVIRLKKNHIYKVLKAYDENGEALDELIGMNIREIPESYQYVDAEVSTGPRGSPYITTLRVIRGTAIDEDDYIDDSKFMYLATSLPRNRISAQAIILIYESRWGIECTAFKPVKAGESLSYCNSSIDTIILQNVYFCMMAFCLKGIVATEAKKELLQTQDINIRICNSRFNLPLEISLEKISRYLNLKKLIKTLYKGASRTSHWRRLKEIKELILPKHENSSTGYNMVLGLLRSSSLSERDYVAGKDLRVKFLKISALLKEWQGPPLLS